MPIVLYLRSLRQSAPDPWIVGFLASAFGFTVFFKSIAAAFSTFPVGADVDASTWLLWYASLPEPSFAKGKVRQARASESAWRAVFLGMKIPMLGLLLSLLLNAPNQEPFGIPPEANTAIDGAARKLLNGTTRLWILYLWAAICLDISSLFTLLQGKAAEPPFRNPLLESRSVHEAWGQRWNVPVHTLLKRFAYIPARRHGIRSFPASVFTFACSGLLHEYIFSVHNIGAYAPGEPSLFFLLMSAIMIGEWYVTNAVPWPATARKFWAAIPTPLISVLIQFAIVPLFDVLFIRSWIAAGFISTLGELVPHIRC